MIFDLKIKSKIETELLISKRLIPLNFEPDLPAFSFRMFLIILFDGKFNPKILPNRFCLFREMNKF